MCSLPQGVHDQYVLCVHVQGPASVKEVREAVVRFIGILDKQGNRGLHSLLEKLKCPVGSGVLQSEASVQEVQEWLVSQCTPRKILKYMPHKSVLAYLCVIADQQEVLLPSAAAVRVTLDVWGMGLSSEVPAVKVSGDLNRLKL